MTEKEISKDDARKILQEYLVENIEITEQEPAFGAIYKSYPITSEVKCAQFHGTEIVKPIPSYQVYKGNVFQFI